MCVFVCLYGVFLLVGFVLGSQLDHLNDMALDDRDADELDVLSIDKFWLQRHINTFYKDPHKSQKLAAQVFNILRDEKVDDRRCENKLVLLLEKIQFKFIKLLLTNRLKGIT